MIYQKMAVWQKSMRLAKEINLLTRRLPRIEMFGLCDQMRRASVSIPSNIAEGAGRLSNRDMRHFLAIARGSANELETQLRLCVDFEYVSWQDVWALLALVDEIKRMLSVLIRRLEED